MFLWVQEIDNFILHMIQNYFKNGFFDIFFTSITKLGDHEILWITIGIVLFYQKKTRHYGIVLLLSLFFTSLLGNQILKPLFHRARPCDVTPDISLLIPRPRGFSFPSGHTMAAFTSATVLSHLKYNNKKTGIFFYSLAGLIGFSRIYLYVHYPSDVLGGILFGILVGWFVLTFCQTSLKENL